MTSAEDRRPGSDSPPGKLGQEMPAAGAGDPGPADPAAREPGERAQPSILGALGGARGMVDGGVPGLVFALVYTQAGRNLGMAVLAALATGLVLLAARLVRRQTVRFALWGFAGVGFAAALAWWTRQPENYFLPGLALNGGFALLYLVSILARWPAIGVVLGAAAGDSVGAWRHDPARMRAYTWATWAWFAMFAVRLGAQVPLFLAGDVAALGIVRLALGWPLLLLTIGATYLIVRRLAAPERGTAGRAD